MVSLNKNILRVTLLSSYILLIALIIFGVSTLYSYLNTGADRSAMLHTEIKKSDQYLPKIHWQSTNNEGRPIDSENLKAIQNDYLDAWYVRHIAYKTNTKNGIEDYFTDNARENIYQLIILNSSKDITIESTTFTHNITLEFFSEDGQLAVITDRDVTEYKRIYQNKKQVLETKEISTYKVVLIFEDGFWRIRHMVKETNDIENVAPKAVSVTPLGIKGINYYPQANPWNMFGDGFSKDTISKDFKIIKDAGLNSVRIFVQYDDFGRANVNLEKLNKLQQTLDAAEENKLKIVVTLFDFYGDYSVLNWTLNQRHAETIVNALKNHNALLAWDIKNEPNLDFETRGKDNVIAWLENMIDLVKSVDSIHPITIGWSDTNSATILKDDVDIISFHYYEELDNLDTKIKALKSKTDKPLVLQEFGLSSYSGFWKPFGDTEKDQANYYKKAQSIIAKNNLQFMSWTLYDFDKIPKEVVGRLPWRKNIQKHFGLIDNDGNKKEAFKFISQK